MQIDRAEERERGDVGLRQYDVAVGAADRPCAVPETADSHDLGDHRAEREQHAEGVQEGGQEHEQRLPVPWEHMESQRVRLLSEGR